MTGVPQATMSQGQWSKLRAMKTAVFLLVCGCTASASEVEPPQDTLFFPTGLAVAIPDGYAGFVQPRSGLAMRNGITIVVLSNAGMHAGTTWSSYVARRLATRS